MSENYINVYNNLINYTRNKNLYKSLNREDNFSDRLTFFLIHFAFFLKTFKSKENKDILQKIYDFMSSMRQKINDPMGVRAKKRKEISQR